MGGGVFDKVEGFEQVDKQVVGCYSLGGVKVFYTAGEDSVEANI